MAGVTIAAVDGLGEVAILLRVGGVVVVEGHREGLKIGIVLIIGLGDERLRGDALLLGAQHNRRAVGIVGTDVGAMMAAHVLKAHPDIGLDVLHQMAQMDGAVGVGQGAGDQDLALRGAHGRRNPLLIDRWMRIAVRKTR